MKLSLLQSFIFSIIILQASWCTANTQTSTHEENEAILPQLQTEETTTRNTHGLEKLSECEKFPSLRGNRRIKCTREKDTFHDKISRNQRFRKVNENGIMSFSHGGHGGSAGGVGGIGNAGGAGGAQSNHQTHKKNNASILSHPRIYFLFQISIYALISLSILTF